MKSKKNDSINNSPVEIRLRVENKREYRDIFPRSIPQSMKDKRKIGRGERGGFRWRKLTGYDFSR